MFCSHLAEPSILLVRSAVGTQWFPLCSTLHSIPDNHCCGSGQLGGIDINSGIHMYFYIQVLISLVQIYSIAGLHAVNLLFVVLPYEPLSNSLVSTDQSPVALQDSHFSQGYARVTGTRDPDHSRVFK